MDLEESTSLISDYTTIYSHPESMALAQKQRYRAMEQDRKPGDKPTHPWHLISEKGGKNIQWGKYSLSNN